jgi:hypothetical protein
MRIVARRREIIRAKIHAISVEIVAVIRVKPSIGNINKNSMSITSTFTRPDYDRCR